MVLAAALASVEAIGTAAAAPRPQSTSPEESTSSVQPNRTAPGSGPLAPVVTIPDSPSDADLFKARVFGEPLLPVGPTSAAENEALGQALRAYLSDPGERSAGEIVKFLQSYPQSVWRASLLANLGLLYRRTGYFTRALSAWDEAWMLAKDAIGENAHAVGDLVLGELADLNARLGRFDRLEQLFADTEGRDVRGPASEKVSGARQGLWRMRNRPEEAFLCGPQALDSILMATRPGYGGDAKITAAQSTQRGTSLVQMHALAADVGLNLQMAHRSAGAEFLVPAMVHWKAGHFAALVGEQAGLYRVQDPTFGDQMWVSRAALEAETSGYFLAPAGTLPAGWRSVSPDEGGTVWGKGAASGFEPGNNGPQDPQEPPPPADEEEEIPPYLPGEEADPAGASGPGASGGGGSGPGGPGSDCGMARYSFHSLIVSLHISDAPVGYQPPRGPAVRFRATYNQREAFQPQVFYYSNLGPKWTFNWMSYLEDDPANPAADVSLFQRGGGRELYSGYDSQTSSYQPALKSRATVVRTSTSPIRYERRLASGAIEVFAQSDGAGAAPRRVFMTQVIDAQGNAVSLTYDGSLRLTAVTDAIGQVTTVSYEDVANPLRITKVTDPFGRYATFSYDTSGRLQRMTDVIGISSEFTYGAADFITSLTTPYGTTAFEMGESGLDRWIESVDPLGARKRLEYINATNDLPYSDPASTVPTGFSDHNARLNQSVTLYWDKGAMAYYPDRSKAKQTAWLRTWPANLATVPKRSVKRPLENRVWYSYPGQTHWLYVMSGMYTIRPAKVARVLDDGQSQIYAYEYNARRRMTKATDPLGRETVYVWGNNNVADADSTTGTGLDLLQVKQKNGGSHDVLASYTYNSLHRRLTSTDAAGKTTSFTYNAQGQPLTATTPERAGITENRTTTLAYDPSGYLQGITGPATGATTSFTYDGYGRTRTTTDSEGYALIFDYDGLDRLTKATYPDTTYEETVYNKLDAEKRRDRLGRWTHVFHDALRRPVATRDAAGRTTTIQWCSCGRMDRLVDPNGNATTWEYDAAGRVSREVRADTSAREYTYETTTSRLKKVKDAKLQEIQYTYLLDNRLQQVSYPTAQIATPTVGYTYDAAFPRVATMADGTGSTGFTYHPIGSTPPLGAGRLANVDGPYTNDTIGYGYDELGRVVSRTLNGVTSTWSYDVLHRLSSQGDPIGTFTYAYVGTTSRLQTLTYPNGQTSAYAYFPNSGDRRLQEIHHKTSAAGATLSRFTYAYDAAGNIKTWTQQYGAAAANAYDFAYDPADQLATALYRTTDPTPVVLKRYAYAYDPAGNRTTEQIDDAPTVSVYNNLNRLTGQDGGGALALRGTLSEPATVTVQSKPAPVSADNRFDGRAQVPTGTSTVAVAATDPSGNTRTNTYQVSVTAGPKTFGYDANGSLTSNGTKTYEWDGQNRLVRVLDNAGEIARFTYDALGRRAQKISGGITRTYVYGGMGILEERLSSGNTVRYVQGPGIDRPLASIEGGVTSFYLADHLGSIVQTTNSSASVTLTRQYDPYGNPLAGGATGGYAFTGREWDPEASLHYYRARYYDPKIGRFISEDPAGFSDGPNMYTYVLNRPVDLVDPSGLSVLLSGYTPAEVMRVTAVLDAIHNTQRGQQLLDPFLNGPRDVMITKGPIPSYDPITGEITFDPNSHVGPIDTQAGPHPASPERILAHELGHAYNPKRYNRYCEPTNINENENPVAHDLGQPRRTSY
jgi:RHS repeat-associated protein